MFVYVKKYIFEHMNEKQFICDLALTAIAQGGSGITAPAVKEMGNKFRTVSSRVS